MTKQIKTSDLHKVIAKWYKNNDVLDNYYSDDFQIKTELDGTTLCIRISKMHEFVVVNFELLKIISDILKTDVIDVDTYSTSGCETCDFGSCYEVSITMKYVDIEDDSDYLFEEYRLFPNNYKYTVSRAERVKFIKSL